MRIKLLCLVLMAGAAAPALAQSVPVERRVDRLEQEMRAVQRRVFPGGGGDATVDPEMRPETLPPPPSQGGNALTNLTSRVDALEAQLSVLTGQVEQQGHRLQQLEDQFARLRTDTDSRIAHLEQAPPPAASPPADNPPPPRRQPRTDSSPPDRNSDRGADRGSDRGSDRGPDRGPADDQSDDQSAAAGDPAEAAYNTGYRQWSAGQYGQAQTSLHAASARYPHSRWTSWMRNLEGRAYLDDNKPATAARIFLANYQEDRQGERAADSLYYLGQALVRLNRRPEACRVYDELADVYPNARDYVRSRLPAARSEAHCGSAAPAATSTDTDDTPRRSTTSTTRRGTTSGRNPSTRGMTARNEATTPRRGGEW